MSFRGILFLRMETISHSVITNTSLTNYNLMKTQLRSSRSSVNPASWSLASSLIWEFLSLCAAWTTHLIPQKVPFPAAKVIEAHPTIHECTQGMSWGQCKPTMRSMSSRGCSPLAAQVTRGASQGARVGGIVGHMKYVQCMKASPL